jgi:hypothetical protein
VYSHVWKNAPRSWPEIRSARSMNCAVVALPCWCSPVQLRRMRKKASSPIFRAQGLERHPAAAVDGAGEHRVAMRLGDDDLPER